MTAETSPQLGNATISRRSSFTFYDRTAPGSAWQSKAPTIIEPAPEEPPAIKEETAVQAVTKEPASEPSHGRLLPLRQFLIVYACLALATLLSSLDQTIVAAVLPQISKDFQSASQISWVGTAFLLTSTAFSPFYGRLADVFGRKAAFLCAMTIFSGGTVLCAVAPNMVTLIIGRAIAGVGGGGCFSMVHIVVSDVVSLRARGKYHGILGSVNGAGSVIGPLVGAALAQRLSWRWSFYFQLPIMGLAIICITFFLPSTGNLDRAKFATKFKTLDYIGITLLLAAMTFACLAINMGSKKVTPAVTAFATAAGFLVFIFGYWQTQAKAGIMPPWIFTNISLGITFVLNFSFGWIFYTGLYYLPVFFQVVDRQTVLESSITLLPFVLTSILFSTFSGVATSYTGNYKISLILAYALMLAAAVGLATLGRFTPHGIEILYMILLGIGSGCQMQNSLVAAQSATPKKNVAVVSSVRNYFRNSGGVFGLTISGAILNVLMRTTLDSHLAQELPDEILDTVAADPLAVHDLQILKESQRSFMIDTYVKTLVVIFWIFVPFTAIALISSIILPEFDLNRTEDGLPVRRPNLFKRLWRRLARHEDSEEPNGTA